MFKFFAIHIYINREMLIENVDSSSKEMVDQLMLRNCILNDINIETKHLKGRMRIPIEGRENNSPERNNTGFFLAKSNSSRSNSTIQSQDNANTTGSIAVSKVELVKREVVDNNNLRMDDSFSYYMDDFST